ncbi:hypothetical protein CHGG_07763 [Chaetomium globosum CBS 148.51]|uniref:Serine aminopeptidase S33 domain-containing protein n=1 Tax=Chaetomium globosum (strain ATCC 6205 / CBS 148.51 / DSM 1962 / NBRC 6347 / NRRL 1970) TaxID=306901 RepID=Q2GW91_CHAGB|nr:uncharacterized protein CHGG_07763 [Chaetomium globosum CBS 148.51]EAQ86510.1 hypothetical protein CHGG_07763 [Chaetomium globosum CBS 148.51]
MAFEKEGTLEVKGDSLYTKSWVPEGPIKAKLIFIHGFSDHLGRYGAFFSALAARGIAVHGLDQRGWGRSVKKPADMGLTGPTTQVLADMAAFHHTPPPRLPLRPAPGLLDRTAALASGQVRPLPGGALRSLWIGHGTEDKTTWYEASRKYFDEYTGEVQDKEFKAYQGWYHQLHDDGPDSKEFYKDVGDWILARCEDEGKGGPKL